MDPELQSKVENVEYRGSGWRFVERLSSRVHFFKGKVVKGASFVIY